MPYVDFLDDEAVRDGTSSCIVNNSLVAKGSDLIVDGVKCRSTEAARQTFLLTSLWPDGDVCRTARKLTLKYRQAHTGTLTLWRLISSMLDGQLRTSMIFREALSVDF